MYQDNELQTHPAEEIAVLLTIRSKYRTVIEGDAIIQRDMDLLVDYLRTTSPASSAHCEKIINHLLAEIHESVQDKQRMDDETPAGNTKSQVNRDQDFLRFKDEMEAFHLHYIR
jgi:hypothetical protein